MGHTVYSWLVTRTKVQNTHPISISFLGLPLVQLCLGLGVDLHQELLVPDLQLVQQPQGPEGGLGFLVLTEPKRYEERERDSRLKRKKSVVGLGQMAIVLTTVSVMDT